MPTKSPRVTYIKIDADLLQFLGEHKTEFGPLNIEIGIAGGYLLDFLPLLQQGIVLKTTLKYLFDLHSRRTRIHSIQRLNDFARLHTYLVDILDPKLQAASILEYEIVKGAHDKYLASL